MAQTLPDALRVEIGYGATPLTALSAVSWTDVTSSVRLAEGVQFNRGRFGNDLAARPGSLSFTLDNGSQKGTAGRFTSGGTQIGLRLPVRIRARYPYVTNLVSNPSFETNTAGYGAGFSSPVPTVARSTVRANQGSASGLVTWGTGAANSQVVIISCPTVAGGVYTFSMYVWVPTGAPAVAAAAYLVAGGPTVTAKDQWVRTSVTFTATASTTSVGVTLAGSATAGQTCFIDGLMLEEGSSVSTYQSAVSADRLSLWVGYVESVQAGWDGGYRPVLRVSASDRLARLEKRKLPSLIRGVQSALGAVAMWPLDDDAGSTVAGEQSSSTDAAPMQVKNSGGGTLSFGSDATAPGPDSLPSVVITRASSVVGRYLRSSSPGSAWLSATTANSLELFFYPTVYDAGVANIFSAGSTNGVATYIDGGGVINVVVDISSGTGPVVQLDTWHHLVITQSLSGTTVTSKAYLDGVEFASFTSLLRASTWVGDLLIGYGYGYYFEGRLSHFAVYPSVLSVAQIGLNSDLRFTLSSYDAETADATFNRICQVAGLPATEYQVSGTTAATMSPVPVQGTGLLQAAEKVATAEAGVVYLNRSGILTLAARTQRQNPTSAFSIPAKCVDRGTSFSTDMTYMVNDVTVQRPAGITTRYVNTTSTAAYDTHDSNVEAYLATDNQAQELASRLARVNSTPEPRVSDIKVDLVTGIADLDESAILTADVGTYFQVTSLPTGSPSATLHLFLEGVAHEVTDSAWQVTMTTTPASTGFYRGLWKLGDASLSQLGSTTVLAY